MSTEVEQARRGYMPVVVIAGVIVTIAVSGFVLVRGRGTTGPSAAPVRHVAEDNSLREARDILAREPDLASCKAVVSKVNSHLNQHAELRPPALSAEDLAKLGDRFKLDAGERAEIESSTYTPLDSHWLDQCLLLRDAARSLDCEESTHSGTALHPTPVERAATAFRWVVRQVRAVGHGNQPLPPAFTLRRGWGSPFERGLVFLALLEQDSGPERLHGCLLTVPDARSGKQQLWACGVTVGDEKKLYLFDPRSGMPLPARGGDGVATLDAAIKDPAVLAGVDAGPDNRYDVTAERAKSAEGLVVFSLSELAPRMRHLQDNVLKGEIGARIAADPGDVAFMQDVFKSSGAKGASTWNDGIGLMRRFLPNDEGGTDVAQPFPLNRLPGFTRPDDRTQVGLTRMQLYEWTMVPWDAMPPQFNPIDFPITVGLGQRVRQMFIDTFTQPLRESRGARELMLRGQYTRAVPLLVTEDSGLRENIARRDQEKDLNRNVAEWLKVAREAYADQLRAQHSPNPLARSDANKRIDALWDPHQAQPVYVLLFGASSGPRDAEVTYQLSLCMHEQAEHYQARLDLLTRAGDTPPASDVERCKQTWVDAKGWWDRFIADYGSGAGGPPARQNRGRAEAMLGDWKSAAATWGDLRDMNDPGDRLAALYRAREAKKHVTEKQ
jgi:hypothetical protein